VAWLVAVVVACAAPAPAFAALTPSPAPLPGSNFQGADGNQASEGTLVDWDALQADGRVTHNADPNAQDTTFAGGTKEGDPAHWVIDTTAGGVTPGKANILDAWSAVDQPTGRTFLYLSFARNAPTGETFLTFELNQSGRTWTNDNDETIPCRREGDILVSYEISGNAADVFLRRWHTEVTDPESGCDRKGTIQPFTVVKAALEAQGAINPVDIANHLPGRFGATIPAAQFGEAALDLEALLGPAFGAGCFAFNSIWMHSRSSLSYTSQMQDYVAPTPVTLQTCSAEGTKFFDLDADGVRDERDPGIPGFQIWADYNDNGKLDPGEPSTVSDSSGRYVLNDIRAGYRLRERLLPTRRRVTNDWQCSFPNDGTTDGFGGLVPGLDCGWGPFDPDQDVNNDGRDFGNWYPAQLTVTKELVPATDPGRFDLFVNDTRVFENAQDGSSTTVLVPPGLYTVSEQAVPPADLSQYTSTVVCKKFSRRGRRRAGTVFDSVALAAGGRATCRFFNVRNGIPAIAIDKSGPAVAQAGDTLHYTLRVTNPGTVRFPADQVHVTDSGCDEPPALSEKSDGTGADDSPDFLDPGDVWTYKCSRATDKPGDDCALTVVSNTGTVTGGTGDSTVEDSSTIDTTLTCPDIPPPDPPDPPDPPVPPDPDPPVPPQPPDEPPLTPVVPDQPLTPGSVIPPGPRPPDAGQGDVAGIAGSGTGHCVVHLRRLTVRGTNISRVAVFVDGRLVRRARVRPLQRGLTVSRVGRLAPGPHRVVVRVRFRLGSGTAPLTLVRRVRICRARLPRFTG
jgi:hypothetical protein